MDPAAAKSQFKAPEANMPSEFTSAPGNADVILTCLDGRDNTNEEVEIRLCGLQVGLRSTGLGYVDLQHVFQNCEPPTLWTKHGELTKILYTRRELTQC